jgi:hypothetical protein
MFGGLRRLVSGEQYRIACLFERDPPRASQLWRRWPELFPSLDALVAALPERCFLLSRQYDPVAARKNDQAGEVTRFRKLNWTEANNRRWVDDLAARPGFQLSVTEAWSPWRKDLEDRRGGPHFYLKLDAADESPSPAPELDWQSLTVAIRHDILEQTKHLVQAALDRAGEMMTAPELLVFDRTWAERGKYTSFVRVNGIEDSHPRMIEDWCRNHPRALRTRFNT